MNLQKSLSFFSLFEIATPNLISIIIFFCVIRFNINPSNTVLFFLGLIYDIINGNNLGTTTIFLLLFKYFTKIMLYEKFNKINQEEWIFFTLIFIFSFVIVFLLNIVINLSVPELSPTFFHIGITLILFPIINIGINFFSFVTHFIKS